MSQEIWHTAIAEGAVPLHGVDADDGFVHLSTAEQLHETLRVHFNGQDNLVVLVRARKVAVAVVLVLLEMLDLELQMTEKVVLE